MYVRVRGNMAEERATSGLKVYKENNNNHAYAETKEQEQCVWFHGNTLQHTATHTATHCNTHNACGFTATLCNTLQHTLQHTATHTMRVVSRQHG